MARELRLQGRRDHDPDARATPRRSARPGASPTQANSFQNLMVTRQCLHVRQRTARFDSMGEGMIVNFDGAIIAARHRAGRPDEIITAEVRPDLVREARADWGVENNIYQLGHRGFTRGRTGGAQDCPYTFMQRHGRRALPAALGGQREGDRRHAVGLRQADPRSIATPRARGRRVNLRPRCRRSHIDGRSYSVAVQWRPSAGEHGPHHHRHADRFLRAGGYRRRDGLRHLAGPGADRADPPRARGDARRRLPHHPHPRRPPARPLRSAGQQALALAPDQGRHRRRPPGRQRPHPRCAASRAGRSSPSSRRCPASRSSTSPARARSAPPTST